jgi:hypothetical protein
LEQKWPVFLQCTQCSPYQKHRWPSLYLFEGKMTQLTKHRAPIMHSKMDFSWQNLEQKWPVFLQYTQCSDSKETTHTWWRGKGFPGAIGILEGVVMVMIKFHVEILHVHLGSSFDERRISSFHQNYYQDECIEKLCRWDIFQVSDMSCLENMSKWTTKAKWKVELGIFCANHPRAHCSMGRRAGYCNDGIKGLIFK